MFKEYENKYFKSGLIQNYFVKENSKNKHVNLFTIFTTWNPESDKYLCRNNTIRNWNSLGPDVVRVLFTNDSFLSKQIEMLGWKSLPIRKTGTTGVPVLRTMYEDVMRVEESYFYGYANGDILFTDDIIKTLQAILKTTISQYNDIFIMGQRTDVCFVTRNEGKNQNLLRMAAKTRGTIRSPYKIDYFIVKKGYPLYDFPDVVIGRPYVDSYAIAHALNFGHLIDITNSSIAIHQVTKSGHAGSNEGVFHQDKNYNVDLLASKGIKYKPGSVFDALFYTFRNSNDSFSIGKVTSPRKSYGDDFVCS